MAVPVCIHKHDAALFEAFVWNEINLFYGHHYLWLGHEIRNNAWVTMNNDFWVTSEATCQ